MSGFALLSAANGNTQDFVPQSDSVRAAVHRDAYTLLDLIDQEFAYPERFPGGMYSVRAELEPRIPMLASRNDLIAFAQATFHALYDHHSITGAGLPDAYGLVPSFADMWIEKTDAGYLIEDVRPGSPALDAGIRPGCRLVGVEGMPVDEAVSRFIGPQAFHVNDERRSYAARVLATGRRDRMRRLDVECNGLIQLLEVPNLYQSRLKRDRGLISLNVRPVQDKNMAVIRFNDSLGRADTIGAFDEALSQIRGNVDGIVIDLRDTASGGTSLIARGVLSRFVSQPMIYQRHILPAEERDFGVRRSWLEEVSPRGEQIILPVAVLCGRWTGSMGEGMTVAFDALGYPTFGTKMAGLLGGITDHRLPETGVMLKLTTEQIQHVDGTPRELFEPLVLYNYATAPDLDGSDGPMDAALEHLQIQVSSNAMGFAPY